MCNLYRLKKSQSEVELFFNALGNLKVANINEEVFPGYPGLTVADNQLKKMTWGFPFYGRGKNGQRLKPRPVNNARTDKLSRPFWRSSFQKRRCLIPITAWAEAEGPSGNKNRTWLSLRNDPLFACAGVWKKSEEWGDCYSMIMTESSGDVSEVHNRMPVILSHEDYDLWTGGSPAEALDICRPWLGPVSVQRTDQPWSSKSGVDRLLL